MVFNKIKLKKNQRFEDYNLIINTDYSSILTKKYFNKKIVKKYNSYAFANIINQENVQIILLHKYLQVRTHSLFANIKNETSIVYSIKGSLSKNKI